MKVISTEVEADATDEAFVFYLSIKVTLPLHISLFELNLNLKLLGRSHHAFSHK